MMRLTMAALAAACIWDSDTLDDELRGVPDAMTLIRGRWHRHSPDYYRKRIDVLPARLQAAPHDYEAYDDLGVAWERLGDRDRAIEVMARKKAALDLRPDRDHLYRYHANLGTFLAHAGRLVEGLAEIEKALTINPAAHFGRERFQVDLLKYLIAAKANPALWQEHDALSYAGYRFRDLPGNGIRRGGRPSKTEEKLVPWMDAYTAISSILRWGGVEGAELYRLLGRLFLENGDLNLAWWSFQHALEKKHPAEAKLRESIAGIETHWKEARYVEVPSLDDYRAARREADAWVGSYVEVEKEAVARGESPAQEETLKRILAAADRKTPAVVRIRTARLGSGLPSWLWPVAGVLLLAGMIPALRGRRRHRRVTA